MSRDWKPVDPEWECECSRPYRAPARLPICSVCQVQKDRGPEVYAAYLGRGFRAHPNDPHTPAEYRRRDAERKDLKSFDSIPESIPSRARTHREDHPWKRHLGPPKKRGERMDNACRFWECVDAKRKLPYGDGKPDWCGRHYFSKYRIADAQRLGITLEQAEGRVTPPTEAALSLIVAAPPPPAPPAVESPLVREEVQGTGETPPPKLGGLVRYLAKCYAGMHVVPDVDHFLVTVAVKRDGTVLYGGARHVLTDGNDNHYPPAVAARLDRRAA